MPPGPEKIKKCHKSLKMSGEVQKKIDAMAMHDILQTNGLPREIFSYLSDLLIFLKQK